MSQENGGGVIACTNGTLESPDGKMELPIIDMGGSEGVKEGGRKEGRKETAEDKIKTKVCFYDFMTLWSVH